MHMLKEPGKRGTNMTLKKARLLIIHLVCTEQRQMAEALAAKVRKVLKATKAKKAA